MEEYTARGLTEIFQHRGLYDQLKDALIADGLSLKFPFGR